MTRTREDKKRLLELLRETPLITVACKRLGIGRASLYRWMDTPAFKQEVDDALTEGRTQLSDLGEAVLIKKVREGNMDAVKYLLKHNNRRYSPQRISETDYKQLVEDLKRATEPRKLTAEESEAIERALSYAMGRAYEAKPPGDKPR